MMLQDTLTRSAESTPDAALLLSGGETSTYGSVEAASNQMARLLIDLGVQRGERVVLLIPNSLRYVISYYAALKSGAIVVPLHFMSDARTVRAVLEDCAASVVIAAPGAIARIPAAAEVPSLKAVVAPDEDVPSFAAAGPLRAVAESAASSFSTELPVQRRGIDIDRALIIYTSGSTARPRGATLSHLNVVANTRSILSYLRLARTDRVLVVLPFSYVYGASLLHTHVAAGGSLSLADGMLFPNAIVDALERDEATGLSGVPSTYAILLNRSELAARPLPALRYVTIAGGALPAVHLRKLAGIAAAPKIYVMYGATEASARLSYLEPADLDGKMGSIGRAIPNVELTVRREDGTEASVGESGEIVARGSNIMTGYWSDPSGTAEVLDEHGFHTGDMAWRDDEGFFWIVGRKRDFVKAGAFKVSPVEIEETLLESGVVEEAAVIGRRDEYLGEAIVAYVTLRSGAVATVDDLRRHCQERLAPHKLPAEILVIHSMPRSPSGKIDKQHLRTLQER